MDNYYKLLDIDFQSDFNDIKIAYRTKINKYNNFKNLSESDMTNIKNIKKGYYILSNPHLKKQYDNILEKENYLDKKMNKNNINLKRDSLSDRIFDLTTLHQIPRKDIESENRFINDARNNNNYNLK